MIVTYHHVAPRAAIPGDAEAREGWEYCHSPTALEHHITTLRERGFRFESLDTFVERLKENGTEDAKSVVLTFDDGWKDVVSFALPILQRHAVPAAFFLTTAHLSGRELDLKKVTREEVNQLLNAGMTIGSHTRSHRALTQLDSSSIDEELVGSKEDLEALIQRPVRHLAYPGGCFNASIASAARRAGYDSAASGLGPAANSLDSMFWLFRDTFSPSMRSLADRYRLSPHLRKLLDFRVRRRLLATLEPRA